MFLTVLLARRMPSRIASSKPSGDSALISMILATDMEFLLSLYLLHVPRIVPSRKHVSGAHPPRRGSCRAGRVPLHGVPRHTLRGIPRRPPLWEKEVVTDKR